MDSSCAGTLEASATKNQYLSTEGRTMKRSNYQAGVRATLGIAALLLVSACGQKQEATMPAAETKAMPAMSAEIPITTSSDEARALFLEGRALLDNLRRTEAHEKFVAATAADPGFATAHVAVATTALSNGEFFDAIGKAKAAAANASEGEQLFIQAWVAVSENDQAAQGAALKELLAMYPQDPRSHTALGNFLNGQQDFAGAAEHFGHATELAPEWASAYNNLGYAYRSLDQLDKAKAAFEKYVELLPNEPNPQDSLAELLMEMGDYEGSIQHYKMALASDPNFGSAHAGVSVNYSLMGDADKAQEAAGKMLAAARNPAEEQNAMYLAMVASIFAGDNEAAVQTGGEIAAKAEASGDLAAAAGAQQYTGDVMLNSNEAAKAAEHYGFALELQQRANINEANKAQARRTYLFKMAIAAMVAEDFETAGEKTTQYTAMVNENGTAFERRRAHELMGYMSMINDDMEAGLEHLAQANQQNPHVLYWSAVAQNSLGNKDKAIELLTRAANRNTLSPNLPFVRAKALAALESLQEEA
jgi:tetratricopeptide (TPR) repeat protein